MSVNSSKPIIMLVFALWILWGFGIETVGSRLQLALDGKIVNSEYLPSKGAPRYATRYTLEDKTGKKQEYVSGPTDASLPRDLPVGSTIKKERWNLAYEKNGVTINAFPIGFYSAMMTVAGALLVWSFLLMKAEFQKKKVLTE